MTPETAEHLEKAHEALGEARIVFDVHLNGAAARSAYLAGLHAAQALISERTGRIAKTHRGVRAVFGRLTRHEPGIDAALRRFLERTYELKEIADYGIGPKAAVTAAQAQDAIAAAGRFVEFVAGLLESGTD